MLIVLSYGVAGDGSHFELVIFATKNMDVGAAWHLPLRIIVDILLKSATGKDV